MPSQDMTDQRQDWEIVEAPIDTAWPASFTGDHIRVVEQNEFWLETPPAEPPLAVLDSTHDIAADTAASHDWDAVQGPPTGDVQHDTALTDNDEDAHWRLTQWCSNISNVQRLREMIHEAILKRAQSQDDETTTAVRAYRIEEDLRLVREEFVAFNSALRGLRGRTGVTLDNEAYGFDEIEKMRWDGLRKLQEFERDDHCYFNGLTEEEREWSERYRQALARLRAK